MSGADGLNCSIISGADGLNCAESGSFAVIKEQKFVDYFASFGLVVEATLAHSQVPTVMMIAFFMSKVPSPTLVNSHIHKAC